MAKNNIIHVDFKRMVKVQDFNTEAIASASYEEKLLTSLENVIEAIDAIDGKFNNESIVVQAKKILREARSMNRDQLENDRSEQLILDTDIPFAEYGQIA